MSVQHEFLYDVYISYSHIDREWVRDDLLSRLEAAGLKVIIDYRDFELGVSKLQNIEQAVESSRHTVIVLTPGWVDSEWTYFEGLLTRTGDIARRQRRLLPLILQSCKPPTNIAMLQAADFTNPSERSSEMARLLHALGARQKRIFISYKRDVTPDESVALQVQQALSQQHDVFIDQTMLVGEHWATRVENELRQADYLITFLSERSVRSEMVEAEVKLAHKLAAKQGGRPTILPVRLAYSEPFPYPLVKYLKDINWTSWYGLQDTPRLISNLQRAIVKGELPTATTPSKQRLFGLKKKTTSLPAPLPSAQPMWLEMPEGTMHPQSKYYIVRSSDLTAINIIENPQPWIMTIKGPRQMGKSSLLLRIIDASVKADKRIAFLDFQALGDALLTNAEAFYRQFCSWISDELGIEDRVDEYWSKRRTNNLCCTNYISNYVLEQLDRPLVLAMDEVDSLIDADFRSDFFGMLRAWYNGRQIKPNWNRLNLALVTSTEPLQLIDNPKQSPFNVGKIIELADFTAEQVNELNQRHPKQPQREELQRLLELIGGHPYLMRRALYLVASESCSITELFDTATTDRGPFGDHLRYHLLRLYDQPALVQGLLQVIHEGKCSDKRVFHRLAAAGLVRQQGRIILPRCQLYAEYFQENLHD